MTRTPFDRSLLRLAVVFGIAGILTLLAIAASAQSLADLARIESSRRAASAERSRVYSNRDLDIHPTPKPFEEDPAEILRRVFDAQRTKAPDGPRYYIDPHDKDWPVGPTVFPERMKTETYVTYIGPPIVYLDWRSSWQNRSIIRPPTEEPRTHSRRHGGDDK